MKQVLMTLSVLLSFSACSTRTPVPTSPSPSSTPAGAVSPLPAVSSVSAVPLPMPLGKEIVGTLDGHGTEKVYELTAISDGTLIATLSWVPARGRLEMTLANEEFANFPENRSPVVGRISVTAGTKYRLRVADGAPWDYDDLSVPYVLMAVLE